MYIGKDRERDWNKPAESSVDRTATVPQSNTAVKYYCLPISLPYRCITCLCCAT